MLRIVDSSWSSGIICEIRVLGFWSTTLSFFFSTVKILLFATLWIVAITIKSIFLLDVHICELQSPFPLYHLAVFPVIFLFPSVLYVGGQWRPVSMAADEGGYPAWSHNSVIKGKFTHVKVWRAPQVTAWSRHSQTTHRQTYTMQAGKKTWCIWTNWQTWNAWAHIHTYIDSHT